MESILIPFIAILTTELLDKSQLSIFLLATRTNRHLLLFLGAIAAFIVVDGIAILAGSFIATLLPQEVIKTISGTVFILFGVLMLLKKEEHTKEKKLSVSNAFFMSFAVVFLSEMGDKTQLAAGLLATQHHPLSVFIGVITAFMILTFLAIYTGNLLGKYVNKVFLNQLSGIIFILIGLLFLFV